MHVRQRETNFATITSFPWSVRLSNKALHQSAHKKSPSFYKMSISHNIIITICENIKGVKTRGCVSGCFFSSSSYIRIGKPTTTLHFAVRFLIYFSLSPVQRLKGASLVKGEVVVQVQNLVGNWQKNTHFVQNDQLKHFIGEKYLMTMFNILHTPCPSCNIF